MQIRKPHAVYENDNFPKIRVNITFEISEKLIFANIYVEECQAKMFLGSPKLYVLFGTSEENQLAVVLPFSPQGVQLICAVPGFDPEPRTTVSMLVL